MTRTTERNNSEFDLSRYMHYIYRGAMCV